MIQERYGGVYLPFGTDYGNLIGQDLWRERVGVVTEDITDFNFGGLKRNELIGAVTWVADKMGLAGAEAPRIEVLFGDDIAVRKSDGGEVVTWAMTYPFFDSDNDEAKVVGCSIVINRSREIIEPTIVSLRGGNGVGREAGFRDSYKIERPEKMTVVKFEKAWELVWWIIAEEMKHAKDFLRAGDVATLTRWQTKMDQIMKRYGESGLVCKRSQDVMEFASSRTSARLLARVCGEIKGDFERADYYLVKHRQSQRSRDMIHVDISEVWDEVFIPTDFTPRV